MKGGRTLILEDRLTEYVSHCKRFDNMVGRDLLLSLLDGVETARLETISSTVCAE